MPPLFSPAEAAPRLKALAEAWQGSTANEKAVFQMWWIAVCEALGVPGPATPPSDDDRFELSISMIDREAPEELVTEVLVRSRRRCALCFGLERRDAVVKGRLCLDHHDQFDSRTSQSKGLTIPELVRHRRECQPREQDPHLNRGRVRLCAESVGVVAPSLDILGTGSSG
jgi:hypothetical protein